MSRFLTTNRFPLGRKTLYTTAPDAQTAQAIAQAVVEARLAACANIIPGMRSVYRWKDAIETAEEVVAIFETTIALAEEACALILRHHPYETPCVVSLPVGAAGSNPAYLAWLAGETGL